jgi:pyruvate/2-oxoglutarate/acetoin dehydrogenase E1 component
VPGLTIACPSTAAEAYGMLKAAIRSDNPVLLLEHKALLGSKGSVEVGPEELAPLDGARIVRRGKDATIVASLAMVARALAAAEILRTEGIEAEVIDLRVLRTMNLECVFESVRTTNLLVTVEEQAQLGGWGAEVAAQVTHAAFDYLDAPPERISLPEYPVPYSPSLEDGAIPTAERIAAAVRSLLKD